jgi:hypothetical protein
MQWFKILKIKRIIMTGLLNILSKFQGQTILGGLKPPAISNETHQHLIAIKEGKLIVAYSPEYEAYTKHEEKVFKKAFYPISTEKILIWGKGYYNINEKGYVFLYEVLNEIGKLSYDNWQENDIFVKGLRDYEIPFITENSTKIIYDSGRQQFLFHAVDRENNTQFDTQLKQYVYDTYQEASDEKSNIYLELYADYEKIFTIRRRLSCAYNTFFKSVTSLNISCYALLSDKENDNLPLKLRNHILQIPENEWLTKTGYPDKRIIRHDNNKITLGITDINYNDNVFKGITLMRKDDLEHILESIKKSNDSPKEIDSSKQQSTELNEEEQLEKCKEFILLLAQEQKNDGERPMIDGVLYPKEKLKVYCQTQYPKVIIARFNDIWRDATKTCPHWAKTGRKLNKYN